MAINIQCAKCRKRFPSRQTRCPKCGSTERSGYMLDWWVDGRRYHKFFDRQHDARDYEAKVHNEKRLGTHVAGDRVPFFREAAQDWLATRANRKPSTYAMY